LSMPAGLRPSVEAVQWLRLCIQPRYHAFTQACSIPEQIQRPFLLLYFNTRLRLERVWILNF